MLGVLNINYGADESYACPKSKVNYGPLQQPANHAHVSAPMGAKQSFPLVIHGEAKGHGK